MQNQAIVLNLTLETVQLILAGLNQLPHGQVSELFADIKNQTVMQLAKTEEKPE